MIRWDSRQISQGGQGRGEDRLAIWLDGDRLLVIVCDGAGGIPGGARAADLACAALLRGAPEDPAALLSRVDLALEADPFAGECTAVVAWASPEGAWGASCGDSAAFVDGVEVTRGQHRKRRLGSGRARPVSFRQSGRRLLVCTDGLSGVVRGEALASALAARRLSGSCQALVDAARMPGGELVDDLALVLVDLG